MNGRDTSIWPALQDAWHAEDSVRSDSVHHVLHNPVLVQKLTCIDRSLDYLMEHNEPASENGTEDVLTIKFLGARALNSTMSAIDLMLRGYYHQSIFAMRDLVEMLFLLDDFRHCPANISEWRQADAKLLSKKYKPVDIRDRLNHRDGLNPKHSWRNKQYKMCCEYGTHASYKGFQIIAKGSTVIQGPFFDPKKLKACLEQTVMLTCRLALMYARCLKALGTTSDLIGPKFVTLCEALAECGHLPAEWVWYDEDIAPHLTKYRP